MFLKLQELVAKLDTDQISKDRASVLDAIANHISSRVQANKAVYLNYICTHNSRRSHLAQIWSQVMARNYEIPLVFCFSGGTEETAVYPAIIKTIKKQGFELNVRKKNSDNPTYYICYSEEQAPIVGFSKKYDHPFNPKEDFTAIMTCGHADENCPIVIGASARFPLTYIDPKVSDGTDEQMETYMNRSLEIACEAKYIFSKVAS